MLGDGAGGIAAQAGGGALGGDVGLGQAGGALGAACSRCNGARRARGS